MRKVVISKDLPVVLPECIATIPLCSRKQALQGKLVHVAVNANAPNTNNIIHATQNPGGWTMDSAASKQGSAVHAMVQIPHRDISDSSSLEVAENLER